MLSKLRKIGSNTLYYGLGNILNKSLGFILIPIYTFHIPIVSFGVLAIIELIIMALITLFTFGITSGHERFFYLEKEKGEYGIFLFNNSIGLLVISFISFSILALFAPNISRMFWSDSSYSVLILLAVVIGFIEVNSILPFQVLQYEGKPLTYITTNLVKLLLSVGITILFVIKFNYGIYGILYGRIAGSGLTMIFQFFSVLLPRIVFKIDYSKLVASIRYGIPITFSNIGYLLFASSDRYMLNWFSTKENTGMYGFGYKISNIVMLLIQSIGISFLPTMYNQEKQSDNKRFYRKMFFYYTFIMSYIVLGFLFCYKIILWPLVQNKAYWGGMVIVPILSLTFLIMGMNYFVNIGLVLKNKTRYYFIPTFTAAVINIVLNYFFIKNIGFVGAAYSALISQTLNTVLIGYIANKFMPLKFEWRKIFTVLFIATIFFLIGTQITINYLGIIIIVRLILLAIFPIVLYKLNVFEPIEIQRFKEGVVKIANNITSKKNKI